MAYKLQLLWHTNPDFYAIWAIFIGAGGDLQYIDYVPFSCLSLKTQSIRKVEDRFFQIFSWGRPRLSCGSPAFWRKSSREDVEKSVLDLSYGLRLQGNLGHTPSTAGTFRKEFRKNSGKTPETLSERFLEFSSRVRLGCPKPYNSRHLRLPEHFQNYLPPQYGWGRFFFQKWFRRGPPRAFVMEFPAVLGVFLTWIGMVFPLFTDRWCFSGRWHASLWGSWSSIIVHPGCTRLRVPPVALHVSRYTCRSWFPGFIQEPLNAPFLKKGCFPVDFQEVKRPLRTKSVKRPIKVGKRPINEGNRPQISRNLFRSSGNE